MLREEFLNRMEKMLGEDFPRFVTALSERAVRGVRVNGIKCDRDAFLKGCRFSLSPLSYTENGFILRDEIQIGNTPEHHAGMIYMQDPGAMATAHALKIGKGLWVADLCSAPGGKSSQIADMIGRDGFLLANEYVPKRAKTVVANFERLGIGNSIVTSLDTAELSRMFRGVFDLVLCDAPCSGEGMFRKYEEAINEWSEENVKISAARQSAILDNAAPLVKSGGYLLYSTCTYSEEENEKNVSDFLVRHPDFYIVPVSDELKEVTAPGIEREEYSKDISMTRRFYPHISEGEGQYIALMRRRDGEISQSILYKDSAQPLPKAERDAVEKFFRENLTEIPAGRLVKVGENPVLISHGCPIPKKSVFMSGVLLGEIRAGVLHPSHHFFSVYGKLFRIQENLSREDGRVKKYLLGEEIPTESKERGFCSVIYEGATLGGGKMSDGRIKNHYPKGLRLKG